MHWPKSHRVPLLPWPSARRGAPHRRLALCRSQLSGQLWLLADPLNTELLPWRQWPLQPPPGPCQRDRLPPFDLLWTFVRTPLLRCTKHRAGPWQSLPLARLSEMRRELPPLPHHRPPFWLPELWPGSLPRQVALACVSSLCHFCHAKRDCSAASSLMASASLRR